MIHESALPSEILTQPPADPYFGTFLDLMRRSLAPGGSELGLGITLFSLAVSIRAVKILEIGRFKGFSTFALAGALKFIDQGWQEAEHSKQRPEINYPEFEKQQKRTLYSVDMHPLPEAVKLIDDAKLWDYVQFCNCRSELVNPEPNSLDLVLIDGDHTYEGCMGDVQRFLPAVRPGGYFVLHDFYGWFEGGTVNNSPIASVFHSLIGVDAWGHALPLSCTLDPSRFQHLLIDTGYMSFVIFRKSA